MVGWGIWVQLIKGERREERKDGGEMRVGSTWTECQYITIILILFDHFNG